MLKFLAIIPFVLFSLGTLNAQNSTEFGVKGGLNFTFFKVDERQFGENAEAEIGYFGGVFVDFKLEDRFHLQPELLYIAVGDFRFLNAPIYLKYDIVKDLNILIGPSLNYFFDFFSNSFKVRADLSIAYDITSSIDFNMKYTLGFEELSPNGLFLGVGYKF